MSWPFPGNESADEPFIYQTESMNRLICDHCHPFCDRPKDRLPSLTYPDTPGFATRRMFLFRVTISDV